VFHMSMGVFEHIGRGVVVYVFLFVLLRFVGKKHVGQLAPFDLLVLLILSETVQNSLIGDDTSLVGGLISAATLVGLSYGMSVLTSSSKLAERLLEGTPKILIRHGRRRADEMERQHITLTELTEALRHQGCANSLRSEQRSWKMMGRSLSLGASAAACGVERIGRSDDRSAIEADR
jgi:uncharacterized membrane protein YcaP (DUF421 family)